MSIEGALIVSTRTFGLLSDTARMFPEAGKKLLLQATASNQSIDTGAQTQPSPIFNPEREEKSKRSSSPETPASSTKRTG
jgi:hypothetical protein